MAGDYIRGNEAHQDDLEKVKEQLDRKSGDYNQFWHDRNYLLNAYNVKADVVFTHGSHGLECQTTYMFYQMFHSLPANINKHLFYIMVPMFI